MEAAWVSYRRDCGGRGRFGLPLMMFDFFDTFLHLNLLVVLFLYYLLSLLAHEQHESMRNRHRGSLVGLWRR